MNLDRILSNMKDYHLPACIGIFGIGSVLQWFHHLDMAFVAFTATVIGGITGHAFSPAQAAPDSPSTVVVSNDAKG
jgi:hypothetical protein